MRGVRGWSSRRCDSGDWAIGGNALRTEDVKAMAAGALQRPPSASPGRDARLWVPAVQFVSTMARSWTATIFPMRLRRQLAIAHMCDLEVQDQLACASSRIWFEEGAGSALRRVEGPDASPSRWPTVRLIDGLLPSQVIEVDEAGVRGFSVGLTRTSWRVVCGRWRPRAPVHRYSRLH